VDDGGQSEQQQQGDQSSFAATNMSNSDEKIASGTANGQQQGTNGNEPDDDIASESEGSGMEDDLDDRDVSVELEEATEEENIEEEEHIHEKVRQHQHTTSDTHFRHYDRILSPLVGVDAVVFFTDALKAYNNIEPQFMHQLDQQMSVVMRDRLKRLFDHAPECGNRAKTRFEKYQRRDVKQRQKQQIFVTQMQSATQLQYASSTTPH